ncbi:hypothetical protein ES288_D13G011100v1 [Gossypium darwinii]|uniref:Enoyl reductase (ER) domain-containing protein n=1 Tax=Gossypium darwinii TaxID=34276 RepID=A0A5D1ZVJ7_GOSDA|nr:hypothetical protein ES288_D13G011100v1 [Gossypium darwinii]
MEALLCKRLGDPTSSSEPPSELTQNHLIPKLDSSTAVKIKIKATSLTFATYLKILGKYQEKHPLPFIPGSDYAGTVDAQVLLVLGAAGGVGLAAVQIGKICGAVVIAVARGDEKVQLLKSLGVDHVVDLMNQYVTASIKEFLKSRNLKGVDVLYDPVGGNLAKETRKLLNWGAQILVIGFASGEIPVIPANIILVKISVVNLLNELVVRYTHFLLLLVFNSIFKHVSHSSQNWIVHGFYWGSYRIHQPAVLEDSVRELISWMEKGLITVHISHTYSLSKANLAFSAIKDGKAIGKVMIVFDDLGTVRSKL